MLHNPVKTPYCQKWHAISLLLANDPRLLDFIFTEDRLELQASPQELLAASACFSSGQKVLIQVALDFWSGLGGASLENIVSILDLERFEGFLLALECLRYGRKQSILLTNRKD